MDSRFIEVFNIYKDDIYRLVLSYTKNYDDTDDLVQIIFIKLYKHKNILKGDNLDVKRWLVRVSINACKTYIHSFWKRKIILLKDDDENKLSINKNDNKILYEVLELPKKNRIIVYLYYYENYKIKEISKILKISETNIQTILYRSRKILKEKLKEEWTNE